MKIWQEHKNNILRMCFQTVDKWNDETIIKDDLSNFLCSINLTQYYRYLILVEEVDFENIMMKKMGIRYFIKDKILLNENVIYSFRSEKENKVIYLGIISCKMSNEDIINFFYDKPLYLLLSLKPLNMTNKDVYEETFTNFLDRGYNFNCLQNGLKALTLTNNTFIYPFAEIINKSEIIGDIEIECWEINK